MVLLRRTKHWNTTKHCKALSMPWLYVLSDYVHEKLSKEGRHEEAQSSFEEATSCHGWEGRHCAYDDCSPDALQPAVLWQSENPCWKDVTTTEVVSVKRQTKWKKTLNQTLHVSRNIYLHPEPWCSYIMQWGCISALSPGKLVKHKAKAALKKMKNNINVVQWPIIEIQT